MMLHHLMVRIPITVELINMAMQRADHRVYKNSNTGEHANWVGALGEVCVLWWLQSEGIDVRDAQHIDYDFDIPHFGTLEVKTITCNGRPQIGYGVSLGIISKNGVTYYSQDTKAYIWVRLQRYKNAPKEDRFEFAWIVGWEYKKAFMEKSTLLMPGSVVRGFKVSHTAREMIIQDMGSPELLLYLASSEVQNAEELLERAS